MRRVYNLGPAALIPPGQGRRFQVGGQAVAVFRARDGALHATQASCPHRQGPLADGLIGGTTLVCPLHDWRFDLTSGQALQGDCGIAVYPVSLGPGGEVLLEWNDDTAAPALEG